jgi:hypothetical protein
MIWPLLRTVFTNTISLKEKAALKRAHFKRWREDGGPIQWVAFRYRYATWFGCVFSQGRCPWLMSGAALRLRRAEIAAVAGRAARPTIKSNILCIYFLNRRREDAMVKKSTVARTLPPSPRLRRDEMVDRQGRIWP